MSQPDINTVCLILIAVFTGLAVFSGWGGWRR